MPGLVPYGVAFTRGVLRALSHPADLAVRVGFYLVILIVTSSLWRAALAANNGDLGGYDEVGLLWYIAIAQAAQLGPRPRTIEEVGDEIGAGTIAVQMLRPVSVVGLRIASELGEAMLRVGAAFLVASVGLALTIGPPHSTAGALLSLPAALLGCALSVIAQHACGGIAFWLLDARATWFLWSKLVFLLGGLLIPLELLPPGVAAVARVLPWASMTYVPGRLASGDLDPLLVLGQLAWLAVASVLAVGVFALGERRLQVVGG